MCFRLHRMDAIWLGQLSLCGRRRGRRLRVDGGKFFLRERDRWRGDRFRGGLWGRDWLWLWRRGKYKGRLGSRPFRCGGRLINKCSCIGFARVVFGSFLLEETEDIIENEVAIGLFRKEEGLNKFLPRVSMIGHFADNLNNNTTICRRLCIYGVDVNLAILETDGSDLVVNFLLSEARLNILSLHAVSEGGGFGIETMQTIGVFVDIRIILRNELPSNLRRSDVLMDCRWRGC